MNLIVERLQSAIRPDASQGEPPLMPLLNRYKPIGTTSEVDFKTILLEVKGFVDNQTRAKHDAARRWVKAVNNWGELGVWDFVVSNDPQSLFGQIAPMIR